MNWRLVLISAAFAVPVLSAAAAGSVQFAIHSDGAIAATGKFGVMEKRVAYQFGIRCVPPEKRGLEPAQIPIAQTTWMENGIRYSQTAFLTRLRAGELAEPVAHDAEFVLLVRVAGENLAGEYMLGTAQFAVELGGKRLNLQLRDQLVYAGSQLVAAIDIPSGATARNSGDHLEFEGKMPPGAAGALIFRLPVGEFTSEPQITQLQDLDFDEEYARVKKFWTARSKAGALSELPLCID